MYLHSVTNMSPVKTSQASLTEYADTLRESFDGLIRLKQTEAQFVLTSLAVGYLPDKIRMAWEEKTEASKTVPSVEELITFVRRKADNPLYAEKSAGSSYTTDKRNHRQQVKPKGSAHVAVSQPVKAPAQQPAPQPVVQQSDQPPAANRGSNQRNRSSLHTPCRYNCPNCNEFHYAFSCSVFKRMPVTQRKEHVRTHSLCSSCLKPGHEPGDCRSRFTCHVCGEGHNTLIHLDASGQPQPLSGTANLVASSSTSSLDKTKLMMTCQV